MKPILFEWYQDLCKAWPTEETIRLKISNDIDDLGLYYYDTRTIHINGNAETHTQIETLIHEYAHALDMDEHGYTDDCHRETWEDKYIVLLATGVSCAHGVN